MPPAIRRRPRPARQGNPEGRMALLDHLRELRKRALIAGTAILLGAVVGWVYYEWVFQQLQAPVLDLRHERGDGGLVTISFSGLTDPFATRLNVSLFVGMILASPVWLYEIWAFIVPGLTRKERGRALAFIGAAVPLFVGGCYLAYLTLPKAVQVLLSFTPQNASNITQGDVYLAFVVKLILAFGCAFLVPVLLVALDLAHVLTARTMLRSWRYAVIVLLLFAAVMTPTPDPYTMLFLATPMIALYFGAVGISWMFDRRRAQEEPEWLKTPDDQASAL